LARINVGDASDFPYLGPLERNLTRTKEELVPVRLLISLQWDSF